jgi:hypothetical protein
LVLGKGRFKQTVIFVSRDTAQQVTRNRLVLHNLVARHENPCSCKQTLLKDSLKNKTHIVLGSQDGSEISTFTYMLKNCGYKSQPNQESKLQNFQKFEIELGKVLHILR